MGSESFHPMWWAFCFLNLGEQIMKKTFTIALLMLTPVFAFASIDKDLRSGMKNDYVKEMQQILFNKGYLDKSSITGTFGNLTLKAVKKYQSDNKIASTGLVGPLTRQKMNQSTTIFIQKPVDRKLIASSTSNNYFNYNSEVSFNTSNKTPEPTISYPFTLKKVDGKYPILTDFTVNSVTPDHLTTNTGLQTITIYGANLGTRIRPSTYMYFYSGPQCAPLTGLQDCMKITPEFYTDIQDGTSASFTIPTNQIPRAVAKSSTETAYYYDLILVKYDYERKQPVSGASQYVLTIPVLKKD